MFIQEFFFVILQVRNEAVKRVEEERKFVEEVERVVKEVVDKTAREKLVKDVINV